MKNIALALLAHPDDAEFLCARTLLRLRQEHGWEIHIATMTPGDCGSTELPPDEIAKVRRAEAAAAAAHLQAEYHCIEARDLRIFLNEDLVERVVRLLCRVRPHMVFTHSPDDYLLDHEMTSRIVRSATFAAPVPNFLHGRWSDPPLDKIPHLYYCDPIDGLDIFGKPIAPGFWIDISAQIEGKAAALACHASQRNWLLKHHGVDDYLLTMRTWSAQQGRAAGVAFAEGFRQHLGHSYPHENWLSSLLGGIANGPAV